MTTQDILIFGCDALGLKGAERYDDYEAMVKTWHDENEPIPQEKELMAAGVARLEEIAAAKVKAEAENVNAKELAADLEASKDDTKPLDLEGLQAEVKALSKLVHLLIAERGGL